MRGWPFGGRRAASCLLVLVALGARAGAAWGTEVEVTGGLAVASADGNHRFGVGGRIQQDWAFIHETEDLPEELGAPDGTELRRARLSVDGRLYGAVFFKSQWELAGGEVAPKDVFMGVSGVPLLQTIRVGKQYEPFGLDELTSSNHLVFVERAPVASFAPSRRPGVQAYGRLGGERGTWAIGVFRDDGPEGDVATATGDGAYAETARLTLVPHRSSDGHTLVHMGAAASRRVPPARARRYAFRPSVHLAPSFVSTERLAIRRVMLLGGEAALVTGPLSLQVEIVRASHQAPGPDDPEPTLTGGYALASVFLTGEQRVYLPSTATFGRVVPRRNVGEGAGAAGALELAARVTRVDLDDGSGGVMTDVVLGANWYLNPNAKVAMNLVRASVEGVGGALYAAVTRFHVDF